MRDTMEFVASKPMLPTRQEIIARIVRRRYVVIGVFVVVILLCALTGQYTAKYSATMGILVRKERVDAVLTPTQNSTPVLEQTDASPEELNSEVELLKTYDLLQQVVIKANLVAGDAGNVIAIARAVRKLQGHLDVSAIPKSNLISIKYTANDPHTAQLVLQDLGDLYLRMHQNFSGNGNEILFLIGQMQEHRNALGVAEGKLRAFTQQVGVVSASLERDLTVQEMKATEQQQLSIGSDVAAATARVATVTNQIKNTSPRMSTTFRNAGNAALLEELKSKLLALQLQRGQLLAKYDSGYRLVKDTDDQIALVEKTIGKQAKEPVTEESSDVNPLLTRIQSDLNDSQANLAALRAKQTDLTQAANQLKEQAKQLQGQELTQEDLLRDAKTEQEQYQLYVDKLAQANMSRSLDTRGILNVFIAQHPATPALPEFSLKFMFLVTSLAALILGLASAFIVDIFDPIA